MSTSAPSTAGDLVAVVDALFGTAVGAPEHLTGVDEGGLLDLIAACERAKGALAAVQASATVAFVERRDAAVAGAHEAGEISARVARARQASTRSEVALARRCSPSQADRHVGLARALAEELPCTRAALARGEIGEWRATVVARETACLGGETRRAVDAALAPELARCGDRELAGAARRAAAEADAAALVARHERAVASRRVSLRPAPDGMAYLTVLGPMVEAIGAHVALTRQEQDRWVATGDPEVDARRAADDRGRGAWMADRALELLSGRAEGAPQQVEVGLLLGPADLLPGADECADGSVGPARGTAEVPGWGPVPAATARRHLLRLLDGADDTEDGEAGFFLRRLFTSPDGRDLVAMDSRRRFFTGALRSLLLLRDPTCRVPWCDAPARDVDHVDPAARGGATSSSNAAGLCRRHNHDKAQPGWTAEVTDPGAIWGVDDADDASRARRRGRHPHTVRLTAPTGVVVDAPAPPIRGRGAGALPDDLRRRRAGPTRLDISTTSALEVRLANLADTA